jgi:FkbM family methyltransferase
VNPPATSPRTVTTINGAWTITHRGTEADTGVIHQIFVDLAYSLGKFKHAEPFARYYNDAVRTGTPLVVDCGANIGVSPMYFSLVFPEAAIVAVEPEGENFELLSQNVRPFPRVRGVHAAIASTPGTIALTDPGWGEWGYRTGELEGEQIGEVEAVTVADVVSGIPNAIPLVLKVDIEGAEGELFSQNTEALDAFPLVVVELHDWMMPGAGTSEAFLRWHLSQGRDLLHVGENIFSFAKWLWEPDATRS